ncbi:MAG TPA: ABC transporter permease [Ktedonobacterales bacterium]|nr:ABC transporter permease [Ktedonobacterales bacterium]
MAEEVLPETAAPPINLEPAPEKRAAPWTRIIAIFLKQREATIAIVVIALVIYFQTSSSAFLTIDNIGTLSQVAAVPAIIAAGEVMLLICGEIDLSVGNVYALAPFIMYFGVTDYGLSLPLALVVALLVSALVGVVNGIIVVYLQVPSLIATLGTLLAINGITLTISNDFPVGTPGPGTRFAGVFGHDTFSEIWWAIGIIIVMQIILSFTRWGLHTTAVGGNPLGASEVGVNIRLIKMSNFILTSLLGGFAGILEAFLITSSTPDQGGTNLMFTAVAGAVIGGTALQGGSGTIIGAFLGVLVLSLLNNGFDLIGVNANTFNIIIGAAILVAMILNVRLQVLRKAGQQ